MSQRSILVANGNLNNKPIHSTALTPSPSPPLPLSGVTTKKHISFAEHDIAYPASDRLENSSTDSNATVPPSITKEVTKSTSSRHLYPTHRHPIQKVESIQLLKKLSHSLENWKLLEDLDNGHKHYLFSAQFSDENDEFGKRGAQSRLSFVRADGVIEGGWTAEQICSVIHCSGSRKLWDGSFEGGHTLERFSQKEYLVQWILGGILPVNNVDVSAITTIEADPVTGTVYTASTSVNDGQIPPDESGHRIRAYTDLYGWVFKPKLDSQGRTISVQVVFMCNIDFKYTVPTQVLQTWIDTSLQSVQRIQSYLTQYGCPPYIRRVAGKIIKEDYDPLTHNYQITFTAKHQPSASYRSRKQHNHSSQNNNWCTDVRYNKAMFAHGLDIRVSPEDYTRIEVSPKDHRSIRIYTTDSIIEGKQVTFNLSPLVVSNDGSHYDYTTYRYNGRLVNTRKPKDVTPETEELSQKSVAATVSTTAIPVVIGDIIEKKKSQNVNIEEEDSSQNIPKPLKQDAQVLANESKPESTLTKKTHTPNDNINEIEEKGKGSPINEEESLQVPKGYVLVPEHQVSHTIIYI